MVLPSFGRQAARRGRCSLDPTCAKARGRVKGGSLHAPPDEDCSSSGLGGAPRRGFQSVGEIALRGWGKTQAVLSTGSAGLRPPSRRTQRTTVLAPDRGGGEVAPEVSGEVSAAEVESEITEGEGFALDEGVGPLDRSSSFRHLEREAGGRRHGN